MFPVGTLHTDQTPHLPEDLADDVRQGYDVQAFLDRWHLDEQNHLPRHYSIALESSRIRDWRPPPDAWSQDLTDSGRDIQGLDWSGLETDRRTARAVRKILSPKYSEFERWPVPKQATFSPTRTIRQGSFYHFSQMLFQHRAIYTHYQLRNVLAATSRNDVFYATQNKVIRTSLACPSVADIVLDLSNSPNEPRSSAADYRITTIAASPPSAFTSYASESVLIAGSFQGEYALLNLNSCHPTKPTEGLLTHAWDGISTHIQVIPHRRTGALSAAFCSNDHKLRLLDVATDTWTATFTYQHSLNCSATSPDGRLRVVLGDWDETLVTDAERGTVLVRSRQHEERQDWRASVWGFSCAWSDDGRHVATGAQDGRVVVYDARNWRTPLTVLGCEMGYARSLQFTASGAIGGGPALVIGESDDVVSVYDARTWDTKQDVDFLARLLEWRRWRAEGS
ncbi:hypothetical protein H2203_004852 [Taxawa tesnikishii (nom. ined.)]|nr:hypothetical protein H2203_004852 [Dothideales sp. JES 119]